MSEFDHTFIYSLLCFLSIVSAWLSLRLNRLEEK